MMDFRVVKISPEPAAAQETSRQISEEDRSLFGTAVILAGGKSSRMGFDKQLLMDNNRRMLEKVIDALRKEFCDILIVTAKPELYRGMDVRLCADCYHDMGPLAGVHAAMNHARSRYVYLFACDMPVVNLPYIRYMKEKILETGTKLCACRRNDCFEPFNAFYSTELLQDAQNRLDAGSASLFRFIQSAEPYVVSEDEAALYDRDLRMFTNINTRPELDSYLGSTVG